MATQVKIRDVENGTIHGGIRIDNGDIICACCGGIIPADEQVIEYGFELLKEYPVWIDFSDSIID